MVLNAVELLTDYGSYIALIVIAFVIMGVILRTLITWFDRLGTKLLRGKSRYDKNTLVKIEQVTLSTVILTFSLIIVYIISRAYHPFRESVWDNLSDYVIPMVVIVFLFLLANALLKINTLSSKYVRRSLKTQPDRFLHYETLSWMEITIRWTIILVFTVLISIVGLAALGLRSEIWDAVSSFFSEHFVPIFLIVVAVLILYTISRFINAFFSDLKRRTTRYSPHVIDLSRSLSQYIILVIAIMVIFLSVMSIFGLGEVGGTILTVVVIVLGLILAMASSNSIGNLLSGLVLLIGAPFEPDDMVDICGGIRGKVEYTSLIFTKIYTIHGEYIEIPNNLVLKSKIINYTKSRSIPIEMELEIGIQVPRGMVMDAMEEVMAGYEGIRTDPAPKIMVDGVSARSVRYRLRAYVSEMLVANDVRSDLYMEILNRLQKEGVTLSSYSD